MAWTQEGEWCVLRQQTRKPFVHFKADATRGLFMGLAGFFTTHSWEGSRCYIQALGVVDIRFEHTIAEVTEKIRQRLHGVGLI